MTRWLKRSLVVLLLLGGAGIVFGLQERAHRKEIAAAVHAAAKREGGIIAKTGALASVARTVGGSLVEGFVQATRDAGGIPIAGFQATGVAESVSTTGEGRILEPERVRPLHVCPDGTLVVDPELCAQPPVRVVQVCDPPLAYRYVDPPGAALANARAWLEVPDVFSRGGEVLRLRQWFRVSGALVADGNGGAVGDVDLQEVDELGRPQPGSSPVVWDASELTVDTSALRSRPRWDFGVGVTLASWPTTETESCQLTGGGDYQSPSLSCSSSPVDLLDGLRIRVEATRWLGRRLWILGEPGLRVGAEAETDLGHPSGTVMVTWRR